MNFAAEDVYYQLLVSIKDITVTPIPTDQLNRIQEVLWDNDATNQVLSAELIGGEFQRSKPFNSLRVSYLNCYDRVAVLLTCHPRALCRAFELLYTEQPSITRAIADCEPAAHPV